MSRTILSFAFLCLFCAVSVLGDDDLPPVELKGAGATQPLSVIERGNPLRPSWINAFKTLTKGLVSNTYQPSGSGEGEASILAKSVDYAVSSCPLSEAEYLLADGLIHFPILLSGLDITYNFPAGALKGNLNLTADIISGIFQLRFTRWNDPVIMAVNPNLNFTGKINPVARFDSAGATQVFTSYLSIASQDIPWGLPVAKQITWPRNVSVAIGDSSLVKAVSASAGAIGYTNYGSATLANMPSAALRNADGNFILPSTSTISAAASYFESGGAYPDGASSWASVTLVNQPGPNSWPLTHYEFAMFYKDLRDYGAKGAALASFMNYVISTQAQSIAVDFKYVPLGSLVKTTNIATIDQLILDNDYTIISYWNPYPPAPVPVNHELVPGTIFSLVCISVFGLILLVGIVVFTFIQWRHNDVEFL